MNTTIPIVKKNVDLSIMDGTVGDLDRGKKSLIHSVDAYVALGELKGGIDPAGADEHWKTANSALDRIRKSFGRRMKKPQTFFVGAAIENSMASEIFKQLRSGALNNAANLTNDEQLSSICGWMVNL
jgi:type II restriction enzyme